jgi:hypothetical protein
MLKVYSPSFGPVHDDSTAAAAMTMEASLFIIFSKNSQI